MIVWFGCVFVHGLLANFASSGFWVPQLTLVGLVISILRYPKGWLLLSLLTALVANTWTIRLAYAVCMMVLALGFSVQWIIRRWDVNEMMLQILLVVLAVVLFDLGMVWLEDSWSWAQLGSVLLNTIVTALAAVPLLRWFSPAKGAAIPWRRFASVKGIPLR